MTNRGQFNQLLSAGMMMRAWDKLKEFPEEYSKFAVVDTSDAAYEEEQRIAGLGIARKKEEGAPFTYDDPIQGATYRWLHEAYGLAFSVTAEMRADDKYNLIRRVPEEFAPAMKHVVEQTAANILNLGFTTATTSDGVSLFNTAHPLLGGGTQSNRLASDADFGQTSLQDMMVIAENFTNDRGRKATIKPNRLWIPAELQWVARRVLKSEFEPGTGNNDINTAKGLVDFEILHYLTSTTAWFLSTSNTNSLKFLWRQKPIMDHADDFDTRGSKHSVFARFSAGASQFEGWFGSTGVGN